VTVRSACARSDVHRPDDLQPAAADLFAHNEILIEAPAPVVWRHLVEAPLWPDWYFNAENVRILDAPNDRLSPSARFAFDTFGIHIEATVAEFEPPHRLTWSSTGLGLTGYHAWLLSPTAAGCHVTTEEAAKGAAARAIRKEDPDRIHTCHQVWLDRLKWLSER
jgi:uncharacterized protein YndB with AHSA1/START domain